jgi:hypothetical protein
MTEARRKRHSPSTLNVAFWHETDLLRCSQLVANGGKADMRWTAYFGSD